MAGYAQMRNGTWVELQPGRPVESVDGERQTSYRAIEQHADLRARYGVKSIVEEDYPGSGWTVTGSHLEDRGGIPVRVWEVTQAPVPAPAPPAEVPAMLEALIEAMRAEGVFNQRTADALRARLKV